MTKLLIVLAVAAVVVSAFAVSAQAHPNSRWITGGTSEDQIEQEADDVEEQADELESDVEEQVDEVEEEAEELEDELEEKADEKKEELKGG